MGFSRKALVAGAWASSLAIVGTAGVAWSDITADDAAVEKISACVRVSNQAMRLETPEKPCKTDGVRLFRETRVTWNQQGLPGKDGQDGEPGAPGPSGLADVYERTQEWTGNDQEATAFALCDASGHLALGGGYTGRSSTGQLNPEGIAVTSDFPVLNNRLNRWSRLVSLRNTSGDAVTVTVYVTCLRA